MFAALGVFRTSGRAWALTLFYFLAFGGFVAMFLYLPKLLTGVHDLTKTDAGARAAGFALLAVIGAPDRRLARRTASAPRASCSSRSSPSPCSRSCSPPPTPSMVPLTICCLTMAVALGLGTGAVFKLVPEWFPDRVGARHRRRRRRRRARRLLPAARHGHRQVGAPAATRSASC